MKKGCLLGLAVLILLAAVCFVPVLIAQRSSEQGRTLRAVKLEDTSYTKIGFRNHEQNLQLGGMLFIPEGEGPFPAVVIIHGSGTSRRANGWYLTLTHFLQQNGIVVLLPDKRGSEESEGDWHTASFEDLATDTLAGLAFLREQDLVGVSSLGVVGLSQGGMIAPIVASRSSDLTSLVSVVGSGVPLTEQLRYEENYNLQQMGFLPGVSNVVAFFSTLYIRKVGQKDFWNAVGDFDALPYWEKVSIPSLVLLGQDDTNVPTAASATRLLTLKKPNIEVNVYEGSGHALEDPPGLGDSLFRDDALQDIRDFILTHAPQPQPQSVEASLLPHSLLKDSMGSTLDARRAGR